MRNSRSLKREKLFRRANDSRGSMKFSEEGQRLRRASLFWSWTACYRDFSSQSTVSSSVARDGRNAGSIIAQPVPLRPHWQVVAWASPRARKRARSRGIDMHFDRNIGIEPPEEWRAEIDQTPFPEEFSGRLLSSTRSRKPSYWLTPS